MAYRDTVGDNAYLLARTLRGVTDFSGRSRRTEIIYYWIMCALIGVVIGFVLVTGAPFETIISFDTGLRALFTIPMFALFVRRLHDQDRSGWWGLILPLAFLSTVPRVLMEAHGDVQEIIAYKTTPTALLSDVLWLATLVLCFLPGTNGPNRFGPDPRLEES